MHRKRTGGPPPSTAAPDLSVKVGPLRLKNPIMVASGTYGFGEEFDPVMDVGILGALIVKSVTLEPRAGNPTPRIFETASGMLNSIGLENKGIDAFEAKVLPHIRRYDTVRIVNIAGRRVEDYVELARRLDRLEGVDGIELNLSCPNVTHGGMSFSVHPPLTREVVASVRQATRLPLLVKLSPNVTDVVEIARAAAEAGADALTLINTLLALGVDWRSGRPQLGGGTGGLSGPAIKPVALRMVWQVARAVDLPVIGIGGIMDAEDVCEFLCAGARAVQVGTANFIQPDATVTILRDLPRLLQEEGIADVNALVGRLRMPDDGPSRTESHPG